MTSHRDKHAITDVKPKIIPGVQTGNGIPHDKYNIRGIAHVCTNRKNDFFMQIFSCILELGQGTCFYGVQDCFLPLKQPPNKPTHYPPSPTQITVNSTPVSPHAASPQAEVMVSPHTATQPFIICGLCLLPAL